MVRTGSRSGDPTAYDALGEPRIITIGLLSRRGRASSKHSDHDQDRCVKTLKGEVAAPALPYSNISRRGSVAACLLLFG